MLLAQGDSPDFHEALEGNERNPILIKSPSTRSSSGIATYFVKVVPLQYNVLHEEQSKDSAGMAYVFNIAFYEGSKSVHLPENRALWG